MIKISEIKNHNFKLLKRRWIMSASNIKKRSGIDRIISSLWVLLSFFPFINGLGFLYVGSKTFRGNWFLEGIVYEIPWIAMVLSIPLHHFAFAFAAAGAGLVCSIVAFARSLMVNKEYQNILDNNEPYQKSLNVPFSIASAVCSVLPYFNGLSFIYLGNKISNKRLMIEGIIYEIPWFLLILFLGNSIVATIAILLTFVSQIRFMQVNFTNEKLSHTANTNAKINSNQAKGIKEAEFSEASNAAAGGSNSKSDSARVNPYDLSGSNDKIKDWVRFDKYESQIDGLKRQFDNKEEHVTKLINERFQASTITHDRFMTIVGSSHKQFYQQADSAKNMIELTKNPSLKVEKEIVKNIGVLESINKKMDDLIAELIISINEDKQADEHLQFLADDMEGLIDSVKHYQ